jgi:hypothetical protein
LFLESLYTINTELRKSNSRKPGFTFENNKLSRYLLYFYLKRVVLRNRSILVSLEVLDIRSFYYLSLILKFTLRLESNLIVSFESLTINLNIKFISVDL